jgi:hypothetical protein
MKGSEHAYHRSKNGSDPRVSNLTPESTTADEPLAAVPTAGVILSTSRLLVLAVCQ